MGFLLTRVPQAGSWEPGPVLSTFTSSSKRQDPVLSVLSLLLAGSIQQALSPTSAGESLCGSLHPTTPQRSWRRSGGDGGCRTGGKS